MPEHSSSSNDEQDQVERELADVLRERFGAEPGNLDLDSEQQEVSDRNTQEELARLIRRSGPTHLGQRSTRQRHRRWFIMAGATAAVIAVIAWVIAVGLVGTPTPTVYASVPPLLDVDGIDADSYPLTGTDAAPHLERLATRAQAQSPTTGSGEVDRVSQVAWWLDQDDTGQRRVVPVQTTTYQLPDDMTRVVVRRGDALKQGSQVEEEVDTSDPVTSDETFPRDPADPMASPDRLPTRPAALREALLGPDADCGGIEAYCLSEGLSTLNLNFVLEPELEAGLIRTLIGAPDIAYAGRGMDRLEREVEVFVVNDPDQQHQYLLLFDTSTGFYVGEETVLTVEQEDLQDIDVPAVIGFTAITDRDLISADDVPE